MGTGGKRGWRDSHESSGVESVPARMRLRANDAVEFDWAGERSWVKLRVGWEKTSDRSSSWEKKGECTVGEEDHDWRMAEVEMVGEASDSRRGNSGGRWMSGVA